MTIEDALSRTILLMRTDLRPEVSDAHLLDALLGVVVVIRAGRDTVATHSGQSALVAAALTMARSGHEVWIDGPDVPMIGAQPPLAFGKLVGALVRAGDDLLPGRSIRAGLPNAPDLEICFGSVEGPRIGTRALFLDAENWRCELLPRMGRWSGAGWPIGGIGAAALASSEAFKCAMRRLAGWAREPAFFASLYKECDTAAFSFAPDTASEDIRPLDVDMVSGGAIANAALFALFRCPSVSGRMRVFDDDISALSNLNRNALLLRSALDRPKVDDLASFSGSFVVDPQPRRFTAAEKIASNALVGVDHIPSRWTAQAMQPEWLGVGATEGFSVLVSTHRPNQPCAGCLHPVDAGASDGPIPTAAFVSLLSGLILAARWLRAPDPGMPQQLFCNALRPESWSRGASAIAPHGYCPVQCAASQNREVA